MSSGDDSQTTSLNDPDSDCFFNSFGDGDVRSDNLGDVGVSVGVLCAGIGDVDMSFILPGSKFGGVFVCCSLIGDVDAFCCAIGDLLTGDR